jgi:hypothetical protein
MSNKNNGENPKNTIIKNVVEAPIQRKPYSYTLNGVTLSFNLRQDVRGEMRDFVKLMEEAIVDIKKDIYKVPVAKKKK